MNIDKIPFSERMYKVFSSKMFRWTMVFLVLVYFIVLGTGCATDYVVKPVPQIPCGKNIELTLCTGADKLPVGSTYNQGLDYTEQVKSSLRACSIKEEELVKVLKACQ